MLKLALLDQHALSPNGISRMDVPGSGESEPWNWLSSGPGGGHCKTDTVQCWFRTSQLSQSKGKG